MLAVAEATKKRLPANQTASPNDGEKWFSTLIASARASKHSLYAEVVELTPEHAASLLSRNPDNRPIRPNVVNTFAQDILAGRWALNGEPIIVSSNGLLNDGQHRCEAVIATGTPIISLLIVGADRKSRTTTDMGAARTAGNLLSMHGVENANQVAAVAALLLIHAKHGKLANRKNTAEANPSWKPRPTKSEVLNYSRKNQTEIGRALRDIGRSRNISPETRLAAGMILIARASKDYESVLAYIRPIIDGSGLTARSPQHVIRERLIDAHKHRAGPHTTINLLIVGWNAWRRGETILGRVRLSDEWPVIES